MNIVSTVPRSRRLLADFGLFYAAAIWGATFFMVKGALAGIDPVIMVAYRFLLAGVVLLIFLLFSHRPVFEGLGKAALLAVILTLLYVPQTIGLGITTASNSGFITGLFVAFVPLFLKTIFRRKPTRMEIFASIISLIGLWILTGGLKEINTGDILTLLAAMAYALHLLYADRYMKGGLDPYVVNCQQFILVGLISLGIGLLSGSPLQIRGGSVVMTVIFLALFPTMTAFVIQMLAQKITSPLKVSLIFAMEPVFAAIFAWTIGGEKFVMQSAIGGLFIFTALIISGIPGRQTR
jgi:drug/metabolite transporter (DMT)-like permease